MRIIKKTLILLVSILVVVYLLAAAGLYFNQEALLFPAGEVPIDTDYRFSEPVAEVWMERDDACLNALWIEPDSGEEVVLFFHGNGEIVPRTLGFALDLKAKGFGVLAPDYRGFGKSRGELSQEAMYADALAWYDRLATHWPEANIRLYGHSLGTGFATYVAAHRKPSRLLLGAPYSAIADVAKNQYPFMPIDLLLEYPFPSQDYLKEVSCPVSIIHGDADRIIPVSEGKEMASILPASQVYYYEIPHGNHGVMNYPEFWEWFLR